MSGERKHRWLIALSAVVVALSVREVSGFKYYHHDPMTHRVLRDLGVEPRTRLKIVDENLATDWPNHYGGDLSTPL